jgi:opacity protein-like surface antigen
MVAAFAIPAVAEEVFYLNAPTIYDSPKILPQYDDALWDMSFRDNPALIDTACPYEFIHDNYYRGGGWRVLTDDVPLVWDWGVNNQVYLTNYYRNWYVTTEAGGDVGFILKPNDRSSLAFVLGYQYNGLVGDGNFSTVYDDPTLTNLSWIDGNTSQHINNNAVALSALYDLNVSDRLSVGVGLKYAYFHERLRGDLYGVGESDNFNNEEIADIDRELRLSYHLISPVVGISVRPSDMFMLDASLSAGFFMGGVKKESSLYDNVALPGGWLVTDPTYREDLDSRDLFGWEIAAKVRPEIIVSDTLSFPMLVDFSYRDFSWGVDGDATGAFTPAVINYIFHGQGDIDYNNDATDWHISAGAGVTYKPGWATLKGYLTYTHAFLRNDYEQVNIVAGVVETDATADFNGLTRYSQRDEETRNVLSLGGGLEKQFTDRLSADFGFRYDVGWVKRDYRSRYLSPYETYNSSELLSSGDGDGIYQDLTFTAKATLTPVQRLTLSLLGMVKIPVDPLEYDMTGTNSGLDTGNLTGWRDMYPEGPFSRGYEASGWEWGVFFSLNYEFGCPVAAPPAAPAPVIEPKLEPMGYK